MNKGLLAYNRKQKNKVLYHIVSCVHIQLFSMSSVLYLLVDICVYVGTSAECQVDRSQMRNKEIAMTVLRSRFVASSPS